jgi:hypothetical protein
MLTMHYKGTLQDGTTFDSRYDTVFSNVNIWHSGYSKTYGIRRDTSEQLHANDHTGLSIALI